MKLRELYLIVVLCCLCINTKAVAISVPSTEASLHTNSCQISIDLIEVADCRAADGFVEVTLSGTTTNDYVGVEYGVDASFYFASPSVSNGFWTCTFQAEGSVIVYIDAWAGDAETGCNDFYFNPILLPTEICPDDESNALVFLQSVSGSCAPAEAEIKMFDVLTSTLKHTLAASLDEERGGYVLMNPPVGDFHIYIKPTACLQQGYLAVLVQEGEQNLLLNPLQFGDVDGSNAINIVDFSLLSNAFNSLPGDVNYNPNADLNCNEGINIQDFSIFTTSFNQVGVGP